MNFAWCAQEIRMTTVWTDTHTLSRGVWCMCMCLYVWIRLHVWQGIQIEIRGRFQLSVLICHLVWVMISCSLLIYHTPRNSPVSAFYLAAGVLGLQRHATESGFMWILGNLNTHSLTRIVSTLPTASSGAPGFIFQWEYRDFLWL